MPKLVVIEGPNRGAVLRVVAGENRIGRDPASEVPLPDTSVSRRHALVLVDPEGPAVLTDVGSTNETFLNGLPVRGEHRLAHGDEIRLGETVLLYVLEEVETASRNVDSTAKVKVVVPGAPRRIDAPPFAETASWRPGGQRRRYLVGQSVEHARISELVARCAPLDTTVLITGETGTGKELVAELLHHLSPRREEPFVIVNCATLEPALLESELFGHERGAFTGAVARKLGKLELVRGGTIFLDEVGELPAGAQAKLLRAIDKRTFERLGGSEVLTTQARFIAATHRDLSALVLEGRFREDLLFRLRVVEIHIPPLRERRGDIALLANHFLNEIRATLPTRAREFTAAALERLEAYTFPGNTRELRNIVERCLIFCELEQIDVRDLPAEVRGSPAVAEPHLAGDASGQRVATLGEMEKTHVTRALSVTGWNKTRAARLLAIDRNTLSAMIKRHGIPSPQNTRRVEIPREVGDASPGAPPS